MSGVFNMFRDKVSAEEMDEMQGFMDRLPFNPIWLVIIQGLFAGATVNALAAFGEELGWRGFLLAELKKRSFIRATLLIGFIWGFWHAPIILMGHNFPQHPQWGVLFMIIFCMLYTFLLIYISIKAKSVIAASVMHGSINAKFRK
jgi:membrane protease YdiL (CAAX protease family)